jgi:type VI secretion system secreted protein VgrG
MSETTSAWSLECEPTDPSPLTIDFARVDEELNGPYDVRLTATTSDVSLDVAELLGKDAALVVKGAALDRRFCGIVQEVDGQEHAPTDPAQTFTLRVRPAFWLLSMKTNSRIFQNMTVPEIVKKVLEEGLGPYAREMKDELQETYPKREYCVQYAESDFHFVSRLLEEEGISYGFDHEGPKEIIVLRDKNESFAKVKAAEEGVLEFHPHDQLSGGAEGIHNFQLTRQHTPTKVTVRDNDFTREDLFFDDKEGGADERGRERESYEHGSRRSLTMYDYSSGPRRYQKDDAARQKKIRLEMHKRDAVIAFAAESNAVGLAPGTRFELRAHPTVGVDGEYLVIRTGHSTRGASADGYANDFHCIPFETTYRPTRNTQKPRIASIQTAIVTGPSGEEIHVDEYGRIKVQFYWDREGQLDEKTSCWVRTQQTWAGNGFGTWWVPRIGMEVVVQFIDGDPDRPLVTGCVYNADNALPYALPDEKTKSTIKSNSSIGGGGFNEFRFEDKKGSEEIWLHAQKDHNEKVLNNHTVEVDVDQTQTIGNNQTEHVKANQKMTVDANREVKVGGNFTEEVTGNETRTVTGSVTETINSGETRTVNAGQTVTINASQTSTINGPQNATVNGPVTENITGAMNLTVIAGINITTPATINIVAPAHTTTDSTWHKSGILAADTYAIKMSGLGLKLEATGVSVAATGLKIEAVLHAQKFAAIENTTQLTKIRNHLLGLYLSAAIMFA